MNRVKNDGFLVRKWSYTTFNIVNIRKCEKRKGKSEERSSEILTLKMDIFPEIGPRKNFLVPPKFGARSPPMPVSSVPWKDFDACLHVQFHWEGYSSTATYTKSIS